MPARGPAVLQILAGLGLVLALNAHAGDDSDRERKDDRDDARPASRLTIRTLSNRADLISGGDALVEVQVPAAVALNKVKLSLNGADISAAFIADAAKRSLRGVVTGLRNGENRLTAQVAGRHDDKAASSLVITNHPRGGPTLLASQTTPWVCATPLPVAANGSTPASNASGLSTTAVDAQCNIATETRLFYRTTTPGCSSALPDPSPPAVAAANNCFKPYTVGSTPADLASTTTSDGVKLPYIVRVERGTLNRGIYDIVVLIDPTQPWTPLAPQAQWNGKVVYSYGASTGQPRLQFRTAQNWADHQALSRGFELRECLRRISLGLHHDLLPRDQRCCVISFGARDLAFVAVAHVERNTDVDAEHQSRKIRRLSFDLRADGHVAHAQALRDRAPGVGSSDTSIGGSDVGTAAHHVSDRRGERRVEWCANRGTAWCGQ